MRDAVLRLLTRPILLHARIRSMALVILVVRCLEGIITWYVLYRYFAPHTVAPWLLHLNFLAYAIANLLLFFPQRRQGMTARLMWLDLAANLLPMTAAAHWSGGVYSALLPIFVVKISSYGLIYSAEVGLLSLLMTALLAGGLGAVDALGWLPTPGVDEVSMVARMRIGLAVQVLTFGTLIGGSLRFFSILQQRDRRLDEAVQEKDRLYAQSLQHQRNLRELSRNMMQSSESMMRRLVRELHDDLGQALTAVRMDLGMIDRELPAASPLHHTVREAREQISAVLQSMRNLSQLLRPPILDDLGLLPALQWYVERFRDRTGVTVHLTAPADSAERLPAEIEIALYRVVQEALTNVARHADARRVDIELHYDNSVARLVVQDDGEGFDAAGFLDNPPADRGIGVVGMRERVAAHGGNFSIDSGRGRGTRVELTVPTTATREQGELDGIDSRSVG